MTDMCKLECCYSTEVLPRKLTNYSSYRLLFVELFEDKNTGKEKGLLNWMNSVERRTSQCVKVDV